MSTALETYLVDRIRTQGPMPFAAFMQLALYHPKHGYYAGGGRRTGWNGHFVTSPELDPAFGALWAGAFEHVWDACGQPHEFTIVEVGPGEGGFADAVLDSIHGRFADALRYRLVERVAANESRQRHLVDRFTKLSWHRSVPELPTSEAGCMFANEVLDNVPVHLVENSDGRLWEVCLDVEDHRLVTSRQPPSNPELSSFIERCAVTIPEGHRFEVALAAESLIAHASSKFERGAWIFVDYGLEADALAQRAEGTIVCYSKTGADDRPLEQPGSKDITSHANWTSVRGAMTKAGLTVSGPLRQRDVLKGLGLDRLDEELRDRFRSTSADGDGADALRALSRRQALGVLVDPNGLGGLEVVVGTRGIEPTVLSEIG